MRLSITYASIYLVNRRYQDAAIWTQHAIATLAHHQSEAAPLVISSDLGVKEQALELYRGSLLVTQDALDGDELVRCYSTLALLMSDLGRYVDAVAYHEAAYAMMQRTHYDTYSQAIATINIGELYLKLNAPAKALDILHKILAHWTDLNSIAGCAMTHLNLAQAYLLLDNVVSAEHHLGQSIAAWPSDQEAFLAERYRCEATLALRHGHSTQAATLCEKALAQAKKMIESASNPEERAQYIQEEGLSYGLWGAILATTGRQPAAIEATQNALACARACRNQQDMVRWLKQLGNLLASVDQEQSARYLDEADRLQMALMTKQSGNVRFGSQSQGV